MGIVMSLSCGLRSCAVCSCTEYASIQAAPCCGLRATLGARTARASATNCTKPDPKCIPRRADRHCGFIESGTIGALSRRFRCL